MKVRPKNKNNSILVANFPVHGWLGLALVFLFWTLNWSLQGLRTHWGFFPLWLGYCLTIDALTFKRKGNSLLTRNPTYYLLLFFLSIPVWWVFEAINSKGHYWHYSHQSHFSNLAYFCWASLSFSTVVPAVFGTAEWMGTFGWIQLTKKGPPIGQNNAIQVFIFLAGIFFFISIFLWPAYSFAFVWISLYCISDPLNYWLGNRTLIQNTAYRDWREVVALCMAGLMCGFFWELWNFYSMPQWRYTIPFVDAWYVFEMPLLGYLGYLPFTLEVFALFHLMVSGKSKWQYYLQILPE